MKTLLNFITYQDSEQVAFCHKGKDNLWFDYSVAYKAVGHLYISDTCRIGYIAVKTTYCEQTFDTRTTQIMSMKRKLILAITVMAVAALFGFTYLSTHDDTLTRNKVIEQLLFNSLKQGHFNQVNFDDQVSKEAFRVYLEQIDPAKYYLLKQDVIQLEAHAELIDDEFKGADNPLYASSKLILDQRLQEASTYYKEILSTPFDFSIAEKIELDPEKRDYCTSPEELKAFWAKYLKSQALIRYHGRLEAQNKKKEEGTLKGDEKTPVEIEAEVREQLVKDFDDRFDFLTKVDEEDRFSTYVNAIIGVFGPHTEYFPPQKKETFDFTMSGRMEGIGARLQQTEGKIKVVEIVPGSASWRQGDLEVEDIILKVSQKDEAPVSVEGVSIKKAVSMIRGKKGTEVLLTVKKADGRIIDIPIIRDIVEVEEQYSKSAVIEKDGKKMGVINLPSFYADFNGTGGRESGEDVKAELLKLKGEGVDGIILDLRNNGGGSLQDAIEITGHFIDKGPVVQVKNRGADPTILSDEQGGTIWGGPLLVLTSPFSASASEIVAAALQDYERAVIMGSDNSYGKGTVQRFVDLDYYVPASLSSLRPLGALKLTIQKFYRITGASTQVKGVASDIVLPNMYSKLDVGEKELGFVLPWDEIAPANFDKWTGISESSGTPSFTTPDLEKLAKHSEKRVAKNEVLQLIEENSVRLKEQREVTTMSLNYDEYAAYQKKLKEESEKYKDLSQEHQDIVVKVMKDHVPTKTTELDSIKTKSFDKWRQQVKKDVFLYEAANVMLEMID